MQLDFNSPESLFSLLGCPTCVSLRKKWKLSTWYAVLKKWFGFLVLFLFWGGFNVIFIWNFFLPLFPSPSPPSLIALVGIIFLGRWVDGCCQPSLLSLYLGPCRETAPAVHAQLKTIKLLFIHGNTHKTASLRLAVLFATLIKNQRISASQADPRGDGSVCGAPWSRYPV